jgi:hypothetical protein
MEAFREKIAEWDYAGRLDTRRCMMCLVRVCKAIQHLLPVFYVDRLQLAQRYWTNLEPLPAISSAYAECAKRISSETELSAQQRAAIKALLCVLYVPAPIELLDLANAFLDYVEETSVTIGDESLAQCFNDL